jgi:CxxC-x17-CxxC domain-containing protein
MNYLDRLLKCVDCDASFMFSADEQAFFRDKGFQNDPKRCKVCKGRQKKGARRIVETRVKCSDCGVDTTVPFKLTQNRPVLCRECFRRGTAIEHAPAILQVRKSA